LPRLDTFLLVHKNISLFIGATTLPGLFARHLTALTV
jgi:hypothetical protein